MEVLLQCLDDIEDLCLAAMLVLQRWRLRGLNAGFGASLVLVACELLAVDARWTLLLSGLCLSMLGFWLAGSAASLLAGYGSRPTPVRA